MDSAVFDKALLAAVWVRLTEFGLHILAALAIWIIGRGVIRFGLNLLVSRMEKRKVDHTLVGYARATVSVSLNVILVVVLLGVLGIETTSFAAFIAGAGLAVGAAWSGLLGNFAAGAFLVVLRPFKAGDTITGGGVTGVVSEIGLFSTTIITTDNVKTFVGNSKILGDNLKNYNANPSRRIELTGTIKSTANFDATIAEIRARLLQVPNVLADPAPEVSLLAFNETECTLGIRPHAHNDHYWQICADAMQALRGVVESIGLPPAMSHEEGSGGEGLEVEEPEEAEESEE